MAAVAEPHAAGAAVGADTTIRVPAPQREGGLPLMTALNRRRSTRAYSSRPLSWQTLSNLLWAACGVNRPSADRTAPYWRHIMVIDIYVAGADAVWLYDAITHSLQRHLPQDLRAATGLQDFVGVAPVNLVYVAQGERLGELGPEERRLYSSVDSGFIGQNVYLYCAAEGLATVFRGAIDYAKLEKLMRLPRGQFVTFAQTVGYPAEP